jgi:hypothetical protein
LTELIEHANEATVTKSTIITKARLRPKWSKWLSSPQMQQFLLVLYEVIMKKFDA